MVGPFSSVDEQTAAFFPAESHPYRKLEAAIDASVAAAGSDCTVLDIGCGRGAPMLARYRGRAGKLIGIDVIDFTAEADDLDLRAHSVSDMASIPDASIDVAYSRAVMEHIEDADGAWREISRVLKPGGVHIFLTPNLWDYGSIVSFLVPNRFHPWVVRMTEGRKEEDTFPAHYTSNTRRRIRRLAARHGVGIERLDFLNQYPNYLRFSRPLHWLGSLYALTVDRVRPLRWLSGWLFCVVRKPD